MNTLVYKNLKKTRRSRCILLCSVHLQNYTAVSNAEWGLILYFDYTVYNNMPVDTDRNKPDGFSNIYFYATSLCTAKWGLIQTAHCRVGFNAHCTLHSWCLIHTTLLHSWGLMRSTGLPDGAHTHIINQHHSHQRYHQASQLFRPF